MDSIDLAYKKIVSSWLLVYSQANIDLRQMDYGFITLRTFQESRKIFTLSSYTLTEEGGMFFPHTPADPLSVMVFSGT